MKKIMFLLIVLLAALFIAGYHSKIKNENLKKKLSGKVIF
jgi:hypothetical protein